MVRIPKISVGHGGDKYDRLLEIAYVLFCFVFRVPFLMQDYFLYHFHRLQVIG